jgi:replicative DNA helicase
VRGLSAPPLRLWRDSIPQAGQSTMAQSSSDLRTDQLAPHSVEAEEAVLGSILINPDTLFEVMSFLQAEDFFIVRHAWIWEAMRNLHERRDPIDYLTVVSELEQMGRLAEVGGAAYILSLINKTPAALNVEGYGRIVERMALRRRLIDAAGQIARVAHSEESDIDEVVSRAEQAIFEVTERRLTRELVPVKDAVSDYFDHVSFLARHQDEVMGVPTGFIDLDRMLGGLQKSDLVIIAARPGMGKSSMLSSIILNAARQHQRVALFSLEMSNEQLVQRFVSAETNIPSHKLREGRLDEKDWAQFVAATQRVGNLLIHLDDTPALSTHELRTKARRLHLEYGLNLIMVDYLQLMTTPYRSENRVQEISFISRSLKQLARELNVPVVAASQLSRAVEQRTDKRPMLSDLRESGSIEQDSDVVVFIYRDVYYDPDSPEGNRAEIHIAKHRNGPTGAIDLIFIPETTQFQNAARASIDLDEM